VARPRYRLPEKLPTNGRDTSRSVGVPVLDGYVRVSYVGHRAGPRFISPQLQEAQIRAYAAAHGYELGRVFFEINRSGRDEQRVELQAALARIERGESDGIIVARLDRLARTVTGALRTLSAIEAAGASVISIEDGLNSKTPFGKALSTILRALAELEVARTAESSRIARRRMVVRGVHPSASPPTGYRRRPGVGLQPDPEQAPLIVEAFQRRAAGATYSETASFLRQTTLTNARGGANWTGKGVYKMLQNPVYLGEAFAATTRNPDAHPALVRRGLWLAALAASSSARANAHGTTLLAGLIRCGGCCHVLGKTHGFSQEGRTPGRLIYRCRRQYRAGACAHPASAAAATVEAAVVDAFLQQLEAQRPRGDLEPTLSAAEQRLKQAEGRARSHPGWRSAYTDSDAGEVANARAAVLSLWRQLQLTTLPSARELRRRWPQLPLGQQRRLLATALESVILFPGSEPPEQRIQLLFAGARRDWYPKPGLRQPLRPFEPALATAPTQTEPPARPRPRPAPLTQPPLRALPESR
jgi:DNA invertase Pin-like site-specific DNA recombinase